MYKLIEQLPTLSNLPLSVGRSETMRLVGRGEFGGKEKKDAFILDIQNLFDLYQFQMKKVERNWPDSEILAGFVKLVQSASFLARGKE